MWTRSCCSSYAAGDVLVRDTRRHDRHGPVTDANLPDRVRISDRTGHAKMGLERALTSVTMSLKPWMTPRSIGLLSMVRSTAVLWSDDEVVRGR